MSKYQRKSTETVVFSDTSKPPPFNIEIEQNVLGALILNYKYLGKYPFLKSEIFYNPSHQKIFTALQDLYNKDMSPDLIILTDHMSVNNELEEVGGIVYLTKLTDTNLHNLDNYVSILLNKYLYRELITICFLVQRDSFAEQKDPIDIVDVMQEKLISMTEFDVNLHNSFTASLEKTINNIRSQSKGENSTVIRTGFTRLDNRFTFRTRYVCVIAGPEGSGKCFGKDTPILMYDHSIKMIQDVNIGDELMGPDGTKRTVKALDNGYSKLYKVNQRQGCSYIVNDKHILSTKHIGKYFKNHGLKRIKKEYGDIVNIPIEEYLAKSKYWRYLHKGYKGISSEFDIPVKIPPYFLGLWLGDGSKSYPQITNMDNEIEDYLYNNFKTKDVTGKRKNDCKSFYISKLKDEFNYYNLLYNKHIPLDYLRNTREVKLNLLAGILDTDGYKQNSKFCNSKLNSYSITQKNEQLIDDINKLCMSLGFYTKKTSKIATLKSVNYSCKVYTLYISGLNLHEIPCKIKYKQSHKIENAYDPTLSTLNIEEYGEDNYYGIIVDKDELFMLEDYTVVHNTKFTISLLRGMLDNEKSLAVQWFSFEENRDSIIMAFMAMDAKKTSKELQSINYKMSKSDIDELVSISQKYKNYKIEFHDRATSITNILSRAKRFGDRYRDNKRIIIIDNLGLIECDKTGVDRDDHIAAKIKYIADSTDSSVILIHHFTKEISRKANIEDGYRPRKEYLKGSTRILDYVQQALFINLLKKYPDLLAEEKHNTLNFIGLQDIPFSEANFDKYLWSINSMGDPDTDKLTDLRIETFIKLSNLLGARTKFSNGEVIKFSDIVQKYTEYNSYIDTRNKGREEKYKMKKTSIYSFIVKRQFNSTFVTSEHSPRSLYLYGADKDLKYHIDNLMIVESVKNRDDDNLNENALFRFIVDLGWNLFKET